MVVQTAREDACAVGNIADGRGAQAAVGEHGRGEFEQLVPATHRLTRLPLHLARVSTKRLLGHPVPRTLRMFFETVNTLEVCVVMFFASTGKTRATTQRCI